MNKKTIVANWKSSPATLAEAEALVNAVDETLATLPSRETLNIILCPPFVFLEEVAKMLDRSPRAQTVSLGAQDIALDDSPSQTGEIPGPMLVKLGVRYVIVGHSDRRWKLGESNDQVNKKLRAALSNNLVPILCVGERTHEQRQRFVEIDAQLEPLKEFSTQELQRIIVAYEPVWAISTTAGAQPDTPESASRAAGYIVGHMQGGPELMLYGGSVTSGNIEQFLSEKIFDGVLVGGASVRKEEFGALLSRVEGLSS